MHDQQSWLTGEVPGDWKLDSVVPIHKKGQKEHLGNYQPDLSAWQGFGTGHLQYDHMAPTGLRAASVDSGQVLWHR